MDSPNKNADSAKSAGIAKHLAFDGNTESQLINCYGLHFTRKQIVDVLKPEWCGRDGGAPSNKRNTLGAFLAAQGVLRPSDTASDYQNYCIDPDKPDHLAFILKLTNKEPDAEKLYRLMQTVYLHWAYKADGKATDRPWLDLLEQELPKLLAEKANALLICIRCPVMCEAYETGGAGHSEPLYFDLLKITSKCVPDISVEVADGHAKYTLTELNHRLDRIKSEGLKPATCSHIGEHSTLCNGCEWRGHIKSPIALGYTNPPKKKGGAIC